MIFQHCASQLYFWKILRNNLFMERFCMFHQSYLFCMFHQSYLFKEPWSTPALLTKKTNFEKKSNFKGGKFIFGKTIRLFIITRTLYNEQLELAQPCRHSLTIVSSWREVREPPDRGCLQSFCILCHIQGVSQNMHAHLQLNQEAKINDLLDLTFFQNFFHSLHYHFSFYLISSPCF